MKLASSFDLIAKLGFAVSLAPLLPGGRMTGTESLRPLLPDASADAKKGIPEEDAPPPAPLLLLGGGRPFAGDV